jgi:hypothetical protein
MTQDSGLIGTYRGLSRAGKWGVWALGGLAFYFLVVEVALDRWSAWSGAADQREAVLRDWTGNSAAREADENTVMNGTRVFGVAGFPGPEGERSQALRSAIAATLQKHGVREYDERGREAILKSDALAAAVGSGTRIKRIVRDVTFEASPDTMTQIVADLEKSADVSAVSRVFVRKTTGSGNRGASTKNLNITLSIEAWGVARDAAGSAAPANGQASGGGV